MAAVRIECHNLPDPAVCGGTLLLGTQLRKDPHDVIEVRAGATWVLVALLGAALPAPVFAQLRVICSEDQVW